MVKDIDRTDEVIEAMDSGLDEYVEQVFEATLDRIVMNMNSGRDAMGRTWPPNAASTVSQKSGSTPLIDSGELRASIPKDSYVETGSGRGAVFQSKLNYAGVHEFGSPEQGIPPRPFLQPGLEYAASITDETMGDTFDLRVQAALL